MARAFLLSHGTRVGNYAETFVPAGRSISFYSNFDENTLRSHGLAALNAGDITPNETLVGPCKVANYVHSRFEDEAIAEHLASESSATGGKAYYVGSDLPDPSYLCTSPHVCQNSYPQHADSCGGVFKLIAETEIFSVACRGLSGAQNKSTSTLEGSTDLSDDNKVEAKRILDWGKNDPAAAIAYWESLTQATKVSLTGSYVPLETWVQQYYATGGAATPEAVLEARRYLEAYGAATFYQWVATMDEAGRQRQLIMAEPDLAAAYQQGWGEVDPRGALFDGAQPTGTPDALVQLGARIDQEATGIAGTLATFTGSEDDDVALVSEAYGALMNDIQAYQNTAGAEHADTAANLYAVGADLGVKLSLHQEQHDTESLAGVVDAANLLCQWGRSLTAV